MNLQQLYEECADYVCGTSDKLAKDILEDAINVLDKESVFQNHVEKYMVLLNLWDSNSLEEYAEKCGIEVEALCGDLAEYLGDESSFENQHDYFTNEHIDEICEEASVVSYKKILFKYDVLRQMIRNYMSNMLSSEMHDDKNILECHYPIFRNRDYFGLGELEMPYVDKMYQMNDGTIWLHIYGNDEDSWSELDEFDTDDLVSFIENIELES